MNKRIKLIVCLIFMTTLSFSCVKQEEPKVKSEDNVTTKYESVKPSELFNIPTKSGFITQVYYDDELIAETVTSMIIEVPKMQYSISNRSNNSLNVIYVPIKDLADFTSNTATCYKTLMFEDTKFSNDMDYNDLILHMSQKLVNNIVELQVQPIAMGNSINLKLGGDVIILNSNKIVEKSTTFCFSENVKKDMFNVSDSKRMINTVDNENLIGYPMVSLKPVAGGEYSSINYNEKGTGFLPKTLTGKTVVINWFIENDNGDKFYAVPITLNGNETWINSKGYPYGLVITEIRGSVFIDSKNNKCGRDWINYPRERVHINNVYPGFNAWIQGGSSPEWTIPNDGTYIDAIRLASDGETAIKSLFDKHIW